MSTKRLLKHKVTKGCPVCELQVSRNTNMNYYTLYHGCTLYWLMKSPPPSKVKYPCSWNNFLIFQVAVACKACPGCQHSFAKKSALPASAVLETNGRRTQRAKREKPNYYDASEYERKTRKVICSDVHSTPMHSILQISNFWKKLVILSKRVCIRYGHR